MLLPPFGGSVSSPNLFAVSMNLPCSTATLINQIEVLKRAMIDPELWNGVLEPYENDPQGAFILAQIFFYLKQSLETPEGNETVSQALELAIDKLYPYTEHFQASRKVFTTALSGDLKPKDDPTQRK